MKDSREQNTSNRRVEKLRADVAAILMFRTRLPQRAACHLRLQRPHQSSSIHRTSPASGKVTCAASCDRRRLISFEEIPQDPETNVLASGARDEIQPFTAGSKVPGESDSLMGFIIIQKKPLHFHATTRLRSNHPTLTSGSHQHNQSVLCDFRNSSFPVLSFTCMRARLCHTLAEK